jgi:predicted metal-dependent enzyme (double-stranded beta helix superfamily)
MIATYNLQAFVRDLEAVVDQHGSDQRALVTAGKPLLAHLLQDMSWLDSRCREPRGKSVQWLLYNHPANKFSITATVFDVGYNTTVHNHRTWGLIGVYDGEEREERYKRTDDGTSTEYARLRKAGEVLNTPGSGITHLIDPEEDIHRIYNLSPHPSRSIHVYGKDLAGQLRYNFDPDTGKMTEFRTEVARLD